MRDNKLNKMYSRAAGDVRPVRTYSFKPSAIYEEMTDKWYLWFALGLAVGIFI